MGIVLASVVVSATAVADPDALLTEPTMHPLDAFTAETLRKNEVIYNQSILTLPLPSWAWWGVTDRVTVEIDTLPLIGGFFQEPHLPVPSVNVRVALRRGDGERIGVAVEAMTQHMWRDQVQEDIDDLKITRRGTSVFARMNVSVPLHPRVRVHASAGASWHHSFTIENPELGKKRVYRDAVSPDASLSLDIRAARWISFHATGSYGTTFVYSDNQPRKWEVAYGFRIAPFYRHSWAILRTLRAEFPALSMVRRDVDSRQIYPVPILPYLYWQFRL